MSPEDVLNKLRELYSNNNCTIEEYLTRLNQDLNLGGRIESDRLVAVRPNIGYSSYITESDRINEYIRQSNVKHISVTPSYGRNSLYVFAYPATISQFFNLNRIWPVEFISNMNCSLTHKTEKCLLFTIEDDEFAIGETFLRGLVSYLESYE